MSTNERIDGFPDQVDGSGKQDSKWIDGVVALIMAIDRATRNENHASAWSGPGFILI
jgi:hypothetical protein